ncbi:hypothetical protein NHJ13051_003524 [Beauveria bassiana]
MYSPAVRLTAHPNLAFRCPALSRAVDAVIIRCLRQLLVVAKSVLILVLLLVLLLLLLLLLLLPAMDIALEVIRL